MATQENFTVKGRAYPASYYESRVKPGVETTNYFSQDWGNQDLNKKLQQLSRQKLLDGLKTLYG